MKLIPILLFLICCVASAQQYHYPTIRATGRAIDDFVPSGWKMLDSATGDLNGDARSDAAIVIESIDSAMEVREFDVPNAKPEMTKPRILIVLFRAPGADQYHLAAQNNTFIKRADEGGMFDPFADGGLWIAKGVLTINFSGGTGSRWNITYHFRWQNSDFTLIGAEDVESNVVTGAMETWSYNFLTRKVKITKENYSDEKIKPRVTWRSLNFKELRTFRTFPAPFTWEIFKNIYL